VGAIKTRCFWVLLLGRVCIPDPVSSSVLYWPLENWFNTGVLPLPDPQKIRLSCYRQKWLSLIGLIALAVARCSIGGQLRSASRPRKIR